MQNFVFLLAELPGISACSVLKFLKVQLGWNTAIQRVSHSPKFKVIQKSAEDALCHHIIKGVDDKSSALQIPALTHELLHSLPVKACATTVPPSLRLSNLLQFLNVSDTSLELTTTTKKIRETNRWNVDWFSNFCSFLSHLLLIACEGNVTAWGLHKLLPAGKVLLGNSWFCAFWDLALIGSLLLVRKWTSVCFVPHLSKL